MTDIVIATKNKGKIKEIKAILSPLNLNIIGLEDYPDIPQIIENGSSFEENAIIKAQTVAKYTSKMAMGDDSGLEVDFLNGQPGIYSARFAGENATDYMNNQKLLDLMANVSSGQREARFVCAIAISLPDELIGTVSSNCEGYICENPRGTSGFGYDPLFIARDYNLTFAELNLDIKNKISHRAKAINKACLMLEKYLIHNKPVMKPSVPLKNSCSNKKREG